MFNKLLAMNTPVKVKSKNKGCPYHSYLTMLWQYQSAQLKVRNKIYTEEIKDVIIEEDQLGITSHNKRSKMVEYNMDNKATALRDSIIGAPGWLSQ